MSINQDIKTLGKDLTDEANSARAATVEQTKDAVASVKTPLYAVIGATDHAAKVARELVTDLRTRAETLPADIKTRAENLPSDARVRVNAQAAAVRPEAIREVVRGAVTEAVSTARKVVRRYEKRGQMVVADLRRTPGFTKVLQSAEGAVDRVEDGLEGLIRDAQGELKDVRRTAGNTASRAKVTVRKASTRKSRVRRSTTTKATARKASAPGTPAKKAATSRPAKKAASATKAPTASKAAASKAATKATPVKRSPAKRSPAKKSTSKAGSSK